MENVEEMNRQAEKACRSRVWTNTVALVNSIREVDHKLRVDEEPAGTGSAGRWRNHCFVLTADHVIQPNAKPSDLRIFWRPNGEDEYRSNADLRPEDISDGIPIRDPNAVIHRCKWEDLAIITMQPREAGQYAEFFDIANEWADSAVGELVSCCGYPFDKHIVVDTRMVGAKKEITLALRPEVFFGRVLPGPNFLTYDYDPDRHYLVPYQHHDSKHPKGFSGAAAWWESNEPQLVWRPNFKFAGICTSQYKDGAIEQIVKASAVRKFLEEVFGPP